MIVNRNLIKKVEIGVNTPSAVHGYRLKDGLGTFFKEEIFPEVDVYLNTLQNNSSTIVRAENISIEINIKKGDPLDKLKVLVINELKKRINKTSIRETDQEIFSTVPTEINETEAFCSFLENGIFPWWFEEKSSLFEEFLKTVPRKKIPVQKLKALFSSPKTRQRIICQFDDAQLSRFFYSNGALPKKSISSVELSNKYRTSFWEVLIHYTLFKDPKAVIEILQTFSVQEVISLLSGIREEVGIEIPIKEKDFQDLRNEKHSTPDISLDDSSEVRPVEEVNSLQSEGVLVKNAGLVLLHPFLKLFFEKMDVLSHKYLKSEKGDLAVHLLHYLATGKERAYEHELIFEKFLCQLPPHQPINRHINITEEQKLACEDLLKAVLEHWSALKSSSIGILQNEFLQREGKLTIANNRQTLFVQRKTQDLLLDKLPWNYHLIKIPWIKDILFVEW